MSDVVWQFRKYYGVRDDTGNPWTDWEDVAEGIEYYSPRTYLNNIDNKGKIEFRIKPEPEPEDCSVPGCEAVAEWEGLCVPHWESANNDDPWPYEDDGSGYWNTHDEWEPSR